jgi:hypothetical protein
MEGGGWAPDIPQCLANFDFVVMVRHILQSSGVQINGMNHAAGSQQLRKRRCEGAATAAKITPGLRSRPFNEWRTNECGGLTDLHLFTVLQPVGVRYMPECPSCSIGESAIYHLSTREYS